MSHEDLIVCTRYHQKQALLSSASVKQVTHLTAVSEGKGQAVLGHVMHIHICTPMSSDTSLQLMSMQSAVTGQNICTGGGMAYMHQTGLLENSGLTSILKLQTVHTCTACTCERLVTLSKVSSPTQLFRQKGT